jgi:hypothetical protein
MTALRLDARAALGLLAVAAIWVGALAAYRTFPPHPAIAIAAAIDLAVTATLALYFVAVRGGHLPRWTLAAAVAAGLATGKLVLARGEAGVLIAIGLELAMLGWLVVRSSRVIRSFRVARRGGVPAVDALFESLTEAGFPRRLASLLATEIAIVTSAAEGAVDVSILGANVRIVLREPVAVRGLLGIRHEGVIYALSVDEPDRFIAAVRARCAESLRRTSASLEAARALGERVAGPVER